MRYTIESYEHGWLICAPRTKTGIPMTAFDECSPLFGANAVMCLGLAHHFNAADGFRSNHAVMAISPSPDAAERWAEDITDSLHGFPVQSAWWRGVDTGLSSIALFGALCDREYKGLARDEGQERVPLDSTDFDRCLRLIKRIPEWRERLPEVALAYPESKWPEIVKRWDEIENAVPFFRNKILAEINR